MRGNTAAVRRRVVDTVVTYFRDLDPYTYFDVEIVAEPRYSACYVPTHPRLAVGWLSGRHAFTAGAAPDGFLDRLLDLVAGQDVNGTRGFHVCEFCPAVVDGPPELLHVVHRGERLTLGTREIRVPGPDGVVFAAPTLIAHYVGAHAYLPPAAFVAAVFDCPDGWMSGPDAPGVPADADRRDYRGA